MIFICPVAFLPSPHLQSPQEVIHKLRCLARLGTGNAPPRRQRVPHPREPHWFGAESNSKSGDFKAKKAWRNVKFWWFLSLF